jgi:hypothetical protein
MFLAHMRTIIYENFVTGEYYTRGKQLQSIIDSCVMHDYNKFYTYNDFVKNIDTTVSATIDYPGIKDLMQARVNYLNSYAGFLGQPIITNVSNTPASASDIWITAKISNVDTSFLAYRYVTNGLFTKIPMYDDGNHQDGVAGDSIYGASLPTGNVVQFYIYAQNATAGVFSPERAEYEFHLIQNTNPTSVVINEVMAINKTFIPDQNNGYDDWIELYNNSSTAVNMSGKYLSDNASNLNKWAFPDTSIAPNGYLIIWADNEITQHGLHANFKLSGTGEGVFLSYSGNNLIDGVNYLQQKEDTTYGRYPNGTGSFGFMFPTFAATNKPGSVDLLSNDFKIDVYPNPTDSYVQILLKDETRQILNVQIVNISGQVLCIEKIVPGVKSKIIDVSHFTEGLYFLKFSGEDFLINKKLFIY